jgi:hypothetical protein
MLIAACAQVAAAVSAAPANAQAARATVAIAGQDAGRAPFIEKAQYYRGGYGRGYYGGPGYYNGGDAAGAAIAGGILGLATGAIIAGSAAGAAAPPTGVNPDWIAYCARKYRSFDPASGTYLANDGNRYYCR